MANRLPSPVRQSGASQRKFRGEAKIVREDKGNQCQSSHLPGTDSLARKEPEHEFSPRATTLRCGARTVLGRAGLPNLNSLPFRGTQPALLSWRPIHQNQRAQVYRVYLPATTIARGWGGRSADTDPPLLVSPVGTFNLRLWAWFGVTDTRYSPRVCAGTPLSFNVPDFVRPTRVELNLGGLRLADYRIDSSYRFRSGTP